MSEGSLSNAHLIGTLYKIMADERRMRQQRVDGVELAQPGEEWLKRDCLDFRKVFSKESRLGVSGGTVG